MNLYENLVTIAENEPKVFAAGLEKGLETMRKILNRSIDVLEDGALTIAGVDAFHGCRVLNRVSLPALRSVGANAFADCSNLLFADLGNTINIAAGAFLSCTYLKAIVLRNTTQVCRLVSTDAFTGTPFLNAAGGAKLYVPAGMISKYAANSQWASLHCQILPIEGSQYE